MAELRRVVAGGEHSVGVVDHALSMKHPICCAVEPLSGQPMLGEHSDQAVQLHEYRGRRREVVGLMEESLAAYSETG